MNLNMEWYFSASILGFCAVALVLRAGTAVARLMADRRRQANETAPGLSPVKRLVARFSRRADNWYCFFHVPDLTGPVPRTDRKPQERTRIAPKSRLRVVAPR